MKITGQRFLIIGDSLSHPGPDNGPTVFELPVGEAAAEAPGARLGHLLLRAGAQAVRIDAKVGRSAANFFARENAPQALATDAAWHPTTVIVMLGTNALGADLAVEAARLGVIRKAFNALVIAIGPPAFANARMMAQTEAVYEMLESIFDVVIDARPLTPQTGRAGDGVHFASSGAEVLANGLYKAVSALRDGSVSNTVKVALGSVGVLLLSGVAWMIGRRISLGGLDRSR